MICALKGGTSRFPNGGRDVVRVEPSGIARRVACAMNLRDYLKQKSDENWKAARLCRDGRMFQAAASRFYYALYQASRYWADKCGIVGIKETFPDVHATMANVVGNSAGSEARDCREVMNDLKDLRVRADYRPELVAAEEVEETAQRASAVRGFFLQ